MQPLKRARLHYASFSGRRHTKHHQRGKGRLGPVVQPHRDAERQPTPWRAASGAFRGRARAGRDHVRPASSKATSPQRAAQRDPPRAGRGGAVLRLTAAAVAMADPVPARHLTRSPTPAGSSRPPRSRTADSSSTVRAGARDRPAGARRRVETAKFPWRVAASCTPGGARSAARCAAEPLVSPCSAEALRLARRVRLGRGGGPARRTPSAGSWRATSRAPTTSGSTTPRWTATRCGRRTPAARVRQPGAPDAWRESRAGAPPAELRPGRGLAISTGAMVPAGADAVVRVEDTEAAPDAVDVATVPVAPGHRHPARGRGHAGGERVLEAGAPPGPAELGGGGLDRRSRVACAWRPSVSLRRRPAMS